jgi:ADP-heptose:LPS heptosyltransferase
MNTTFLMNYGAGAVISSIPALLKFKKLNPDDDFKILVYAWDQVFFNHPELQHRVFDISQKGMFDLLVKNSNLVNPEPYHVNDYYNQRIHLSEAFDEEINHTKDHSDLEPLRLYLSDFERKSGKRCVNEVTLQTKKDKVIVFQPYGSGIGIKNNRPIDQSARSLDVDDYLYMANKLSKHATVIFFGPDEFRHPGDFVTPKLDGWQKDIRFWMSLINEADYFIGCDSIGQHIAKGFDKKGSVIMGGTHDINVTYPDHFTIHRNGIQPVYNPIRITPKDSELADRMNEKTMVFSKEQLDYIIQHTINQL